MLNPWAESRLHLAISGKSETQGPQLGLVKNNRTGFSRPSHDSREDAPPSRRSKLKFGARDPIGSPYDDGTVVPVPSGLTVGSLLSMDSNRSSTRPCCAITWIRSTTEAISNPA